MPQLQKNKIPCILKFTKKREVNFKDNMDNRNGTPELLILQNLEQYQTLALQLYDI